MLPLILLGAAYLIEKSLQPDTEKFHLGGDMSKHLAPNGKPSKLTHEQWHLVRTPAFKAWFGDWENDAENASKVVDEETKEPLVVYHGSPKERFNKFNIVEGKDTKSKMQLLFGSHFASTKKDAEIYTKGKGSIYEVFLNIRNILDLGEHYEKTNPKFNLIVDVIKSLKIDKKYKNAFDYVMFTETGDYGGKSNDVQRVFLTQIMLDSYSPKKVFNILKNKFNGISYVPYSPQGFNKVSFYSKSFIAFEPEQIKLADGSNMAFNGSNPDIRYEEGGDIKNDTKLSDSILEYINYNNLHIGNDVFVKRFSFSNPFENKGKIIGYKIKKSKARVKKENKGFSSNDIIYVVTDKGDIILASDIVKNPDISFDDGGEVGIDGDILKKSDRYQIKDVVKFGMLFGYKIVDTKDFNETVYEYGEHELSKAQSRVNLMNLLDRPNKS
jgi:hypothetical protein